MTVATNRLRLYIDDGRQVWTPVDIQVPADMPDNQRAQLLADWLRKIASALTDEDEHDASTEETAS